MNVWEKLKVLSTVAAAVLIPVVLGVIGNRYTQAIKEREVEGRFVELAVNILAEPPSEETKNLRLWATRVVNQYSGVALDSAATNEVLRIRLPATTTRPRGDRVAAAEKQRQGFELILRGRYDEAIQAFQEAEAAYPTYGNAYEIGRLLSRNRAALADPAQRRAVLKRIVDEYAWGAPEDLLAELRRRVEPVPR